MSLSVFVIGIGFGAFLTGIGSGDLLGAQPAPPVKPKYPVTYIVTYRRGGRR